jgi:hypothetical protein
LEIIRLVEDSHMSARMTLATLGIPRTTFYRWYDRYLQRGEAGMLDQRPKPKHVWNRVPDEARRKFVDFALKETELSQRELAVTFTDQERYFVSKSTVYRTLKAHDLITSQPLSSSRQPMSSKTKRLRSISFGKQTSPTSRFWAGVGSISVRSWTITAATSCPGSFAPTCGQRM